MATQRIDLAAEANNRFGLQLYRSIQSELGPEENVFFSPLSIYTALGMTYLGTRGNTAKQMEVTMKLGPLGKEVHHAFKDLNSDMFGDSHPFHQLKLANRLYGQKGFNFIPDYLAATQDLYGAKLEAVDFVQENEVTRKAINAWVEEQTAGKIRDLLGELSADSKLILVNAIYFKGKWIEQFETNATRELPFNTSSGVITVPMMFQQERFDYYYDESLKCKVLVMGYKGGKVNMMIALPDDTDGLGKLESNLSQEVLQSWNTNMRRPKVRVTVPKFKFTKSFSLEDRLKEIGITDLFQDDVADVSGIAKDKLVVSKVVHKAFLEVNEQGTEAAAATAVMMMLGCAFGMKEEEPKEFKADHPFIFFIRDQSSGAVIFMGRVMRPVLE